MITYHRTSILTSQAQTVVNTINTVGVMGKGIALQFKRKWPANARAYEAACRRGEVVPGKMFVFDNGGLVEPKFIVNVKPEIFHAPCGV